MAELTVQERLQPSLLDRLTDEAPHQTQESREQRVLTMRRLREVVLRDMAWLLNTVHLTATEDLDACPEVARSVLNFGVPDLTGITASSVDADELAQMLREAIWNFEPRILKQTVRVRVVTAPDQMNRNAISFEIEGELWGRPLPQRLYLKTELDLETGDIQIQESFGRE